MKWQPAETAPKDESIILLNVGWPWPVAACWSPSEEQWVYANFQSSMFEGKHDNYFENEYEDDNNVTAWMPMPEIE